MNVDTIIIGRYKFINCSIGKLCIFSSELSLYKFFSELKIKNKQDPYSCYL